MKNLEIERKWWIDAFPSNLPLLFEAQQEQGYLAFLPNTVRIRKTITDKVSTFKLTFKSDGQLVRKEIEMDISQSQYEDLSPLLLAPVACKQYKAYQLPTGHTLECSLVDEGEQSSFFYAEIEFATVQEANAFKPPIFLSKEVTGNKGVTMAEYCQNKAGFQKK